MLSIIAEVFAHGGTGIWRQVKQWSRVGRRGSDDDSLIHHTFALQTFNKCGNFGEFLANSNVHVNDAGLLLGLVNHGVDSNGSFTGLAVADEQFTLAAADWNHGVD